LKPIFVAELRIAARLLMQGWIAVASRLAVQSTRDSRCHRPRRRAVSVKRRLENGLVKGIIRRLSSAMSAVVERSSVDTVSDRAWHWWERYFHTARNGLVQAAVRRCWRQGGNLGADKAARPRIALGFGRGDLEGKGRRSRHRPGGFGTTRGGGFEILCQNTF